MSYIPVQDVGQFAVQGGPRASAAAWSGWGVAASGFASFACIGHFAQGAFRSSSINREHVVGAPQSKKYNHTFPKVAVQRVTNTGGL